MDRMALQYQVEQFLYHEADLLDRRSYREWFALVDEDIHYWMPLRRTVTQRNIEREFTKPGDVGVLRRRLQRLAIARREALHRLVLVGRPAVAHAAFRVQCADHRPCL